jgi:hypothetical protein
MPELSTSAITVLVSIGGAALAFLLSVIHRHSIYLYGHRIPPVDSRNRKPGTDFRLAIQNAENGTLEGPLRIELACATGAKFDGEPQVFAGPRAIVAGLAAGGRRYSLMFDRLPAYDTWMIHCRVARDADATTADQGGPLGFGDRHGLVLKLSEIDEDGNLRKRRLSRLSVSELALSPDDALKVVGRARKPLLPLGVGTLVLAVAVYFLTAAFWLWRARGDPLHATWRVDLPALLVIAVVTSAFIRSVAPPPARAIQGYLEATQPRPLTDGGGAPSARARATS